MAELKDNREILPGLRGAGVFYLLTFAFSWAIWSILIIFPQTADWAGLIILIGAYGPLLAGLLLSRLAGGRGGTRAWLRQVGRVRGQWRWLLLGGLGLPLIIGLVHLALFHLSGGSYTLSSDPPWYWALSAAPLSIFLVFWMSSAVEEFGWQGFAMPRLVQRLHPLPACLLHGLLWGTWHLPLYLTGAWSGDTQPPLLLLGITLTLAPTMFWLTQRAGGSVWPAVLLHAGTNYYSAIFTAVQQFPVFRDLPEANFVAIKLLIYLAIALLLIVVTRGRLGLPAADSAPLADSDGAVRVAT